MQLSHQAAPRQLLCRPQEDERRKVFVFFTLSDRGTAELSPWYPRTLPLSSVVAMAAKEAAIGSEVRIGASTLFQDPQVRSYVCVCVSA